MFALTAQCIQTSQKLLTRPQGHFLVRRGGGRNEENLKTQAGPRSYKL